MDLEIAALMHLILNTNKKESTLLTLKTLKEVTLKGTTTAKAAYNQQWRRF